MATKTHAPKWCSDAKLTTKGWAHPRTGEVLIAMKVSKEHVERWEAANSPDKEVVVAAEKPVKTKAKAKKKAAKKTAKAVTETGPSDEEILSTLEANHEEAPNVEAIE